MTHLTTPRYRSTMDIGSNIKELRLDRAMSLADLGQASGINRGYLSRIESGKISSPGPDMLLRIAGGLGVGVGELFGESPQGPVALLSARGDEPEAFMALLRNNSRSLTLDERAFLEQVLREVGHTRQAEFYDFWRDQLARYRGTPRQQLMRLVLGIHPDYEPQPVEMLPYIWELTTILLGAVAAGPESR
ncbi:MAG: helix-turn-helix domain-containing protein [Acidobacteriota bacterium]